MILDKSIFRCLLASAVLTFLANSPQVATGQTVLKQQPATQTALRLASVFSNHMVLQRDQKIPVWGKANPHAMVSVQLAGASYTTTSDSAGNWRIDAKPLTTGDPIEMQVSSEEESVHLTDILVGEVWLASGQSNMQWPVVRSKNAKQEIAAAKWPEIRLLKVARVGKISPQTEFQTAGWRACTPASIKQFSAVAYYFGRDLHQELNVPIGLISSNFGGTPMEAWTSVEAMKSSPTFSWAVKKAAEPFNNDKSDWWAEPKNHPAALYNAMIHPLVPYGIRGVIWYQGESNADRHRAYRELSETMIADWRKRWGQGDFPFLLVQLAGWKAGATDWPFVREAQWQTIQTVPNTGMAVAMDIGDKADIHPKNKQQVGKRLALAARALVYGEKIGHQGPTYHEMEIHEETIRLKFDYVYDGLRAINDAPQGFTIANVDMKFVAADAVIEGDEIVVSSDEIMKPTAVRYNWKSENTGNLSNSIGLPAIPFRTDQQQQ